MKSPNVSEVVDQDVGKVLRGLKDITGITLEDLSKLSGGSISHISAVLRGQRTSTDEVTGKLATVFGISADEITDQLIFVIQNASENSESIITRYNDLDMAGLFQAALEIQTLIRARMIETMNSLTRQGELF